MKDDYIIYIKNLDDITPEIGPALLWSCSINEVYLGILLVGNALFDVVLQYITSKRKPLKIREPKTGDIHMIEHWDLPNENNTILLMTDKLKEKFLRKETLWKKDFTICRLCKNRIKRLKFECAYRKSTCKPEWKIY